MIKIIISFYQNKDKSIMSDDDWENDVDDLIANKAPTDSKKIKDEEEVDSEEEREKVRQENKKK